MTGYCQCGREHPQQRPRTDEWLVLQGTIDQLTTDLSKKQEEIDRLKALVDSNDTSKPPERKEATLSTALTKLSEYDEHLLANILLTGDISKLDDKQKWIYYKAICERVGLDPFTQPFQILKVQGKQILYATKGCAEQLVARHKLSVDVGDVIRDIEAGIATCKATATVTVQVDAAIGRRSTSKVGAVPIVEYNSNGSIKPMRAEALCNAIMKCETKASRRAVLALMGLGMIDESERHSIPNAVDVEFRVVDDCIVEEATESAFDAVNNDLAEQGRLTIDQRKEVVALWKQDYPNHDQEITEEIILSVFRTLDFDQTEEAFEDAVDAIIAYENEYKRAKEVREAKAGKRVRKGEYKSAASDAEAEKSTKNASIAAADAVDVSISESGTTDLGKPVNGAKNLSGSASAKLPKDEGETALDSMKTESVSNAETSETLPVSPVEQKLSSASVGGKKRRRDPKLQAAASDTETSSSVPDNPKDQAVDTGSLSIAPIIPSTLEPASSVESISTKYRNSVPSLKQMKERPIVLSNDTDKALAVVIQRAQTIQENPKWDEEKVFLKAIADSRGWRNGPEALKNKFEWESARHASLLTWDQVVEFAEYFATGEVVK